MSDMNPDNNRDTFQGRGHRIKELEEENKRLKGLLKEFLKDLENSPQQVSFEKEVLVKFFSKMIEQSNG